MTMEYPDGVADLLSSSSSNAENDSWFQILWFVVLFVIVIYLCKLYAKRPCCASTMIHDSMCQLSISSHHSRRQLC